MKTLIPSAFKSSFLRSLWSLVFAAGIAGLSQTNAAPAIAGCAGDADAVAAANRPLPATTTSTSLPGSCGDGVVDPGEDCDPPESFCRGGCNPLTGICVDFMCGSDCSCPPPLCGDGLVDPKENCDPPGSACAHGTCNARCKCRR